MWRAPSRKSYLFYIIGRYFDVDHIYIILIIFSRACGLRRRRYFMFDTIQHTIGTLIRTIFNRIYNKYRVMIYAVIFQALLLTRDSCARGRVYAHTRLAHIIAYTYAHVIELVYIYRIGESETARVPHIIIIRVYYL